MTGRVTDEMTMHHSHVEDSEKRAAVARIALLVEGDSGERTGCQPKSLKERVSEG